MIKLFHSYQYINNTKSIKFNQTKNIIESNDGKFILGLIGIPNISNITIDLEKSLVSKRLSKRSLYRNHTRHNIKVFINIEKNKINYFLKNTDEFNKNLLYNLQKNYVQYSLNDSIFVIFTKENKI